MKAGDNIRVQFYICGSPAYCKDYEVEEFRFCLGYFEEPQDRMAGKFTPLCNLYERGPESKDGYISNYGEYYTNPVQAWMDIP